MVLFAKRVRACAPPPMSSSVSSASLYLTSSTKNSWQRALSSIGDADGDVAEARGSGAVAGAHGLRGLALAAIGRAPKRPVVFIADGVAGIPKLRGDAAIAGVLEHPHL